nr:MBL fold metallo-hydrolase [Sediminibacterium sp.]
QDGEEIDLGQRKLQIIAVPGHTPDALALLDKDHGYLWTGDTFYEGPIYLFAKETDLFAYEKSIAKLAALAPQLKVIFPSHNNPVADPARLIALKKNFARVKAGKVKGADAGNQSLLFQFPYFGLLIRKDRLLALQRLQDPG